MYVYGFFDESGKTLSNVTVSVVKYNTIMSTSYYVAAPYILQLIVSNDKVFK